MDQKKFNMFTWAKSLIINKITTSLIMMKFYNSIVPFNLFCDNDLGNFEKSENYPQKLSPEKLSNRLKCKI